MTATAGERRRRSSQVGRKRAGPLASPRFGQRLAVLMLVVGALYAGDRLYAAIHAARTYGPAYMGMSRAEVSYLWGRPSVRSPDNALWRVRDGDSRTSFLFDAADQLTTIGCDGAGSTDAGCPDAFGVHVGDGEDAVWVKLGMPTDQVYDADSKIMAYPGVGIRLKLRRSTVVAIEHRHISDIGAFAARALSLMAP